MRKISRVVVLGSGRWAKVLATEVGKCFDDSVEVYFCVARRMDEIRQWLNDQKKLKHIRLVAQLPSMTNQGTGIAFIVNSAHEHDEVIKSALLKGYHVVSEKPLTVSLEQSQQVIQLAHELNRTIFSINTYRFASYLTDFKNLLPSDKPMTRLDLLWTDPAEEERYGASKHYDPRVPIVMDVLPHIVSILEAIGQVEAPSLRSLNLKQGGAEVDLDLSVGPVESHIQMSRVADKRCRRLIVWHNNVCHEFDFFTEPGIVSSSHTFSIDPAWESKLKPLASMLYSVINYFENGVTDPRLSVETAIKANRLIDSVMPNYRAQQRRFLSERFNSQNSVRDPEMRYALVELLQKSRKLTSENIELVLEALSELMTELTPVSRLKKDSAVLDKDLQQ
jgi:predicted dehydrogenase